MRELVTATKKHIGMFVKVLARVFALAICPILFMCPTAAAPVTKWDDDENKPQRNKDGNVVYVEIAYTPYRKQWLFHASDADEVVYGGAKGGGKSCALVMDAFAYAYAFPKSKVYLFRKTFDELESNLVEELKKRVPQITKENPDGLYWYHEGKHIALVRNGSRIFFRYIRNLADARRYNGREMDYCGVDELTQHEEEAIQILRSCVRSPLGYPARFRGSCNPGDIGHVHVKKRYITPTMYGKKTYTDPVTGNKIALFLRK